MGITVNVEMFGSRLILINFGDLALEHKITKLKTANIFAHMYHIIEMGHATTKLKIRQYFIFAGF